MDMPCVATWLPAVTECSSCQRPSIRANFIFLLLLPLLLGLWTPEETAKVLDDIRPWLAQQEGLGEGHEAAWAAFVNRCRDNLHLILTMSPVGDAFRTRCG
jgi:hypothetical protein